MTYVTWQRQDDVTYAKMCFPSLVTDTMRRFLRLESSKKLQGKNAWGGWYPPPLGVRGLNLLHASRANCLLRWVYKHTRMMLNLLHASRANHLLRWVHEQTRGMGSGITMFFVWYCPCVGSLNKFLESLVFILSKLWLLFVTKKTVFDGSFLSRLEDIPQIWTKLELCNRPIPAIPSFVGSSCCSIVHLSWCSYNYNCSDE